MLDTDGAQRRGWPSGWLIWCMKPKGTWGSTALKQGGSAAVAAGRSGGDVLHLCTLTLACAQACLHHMQPLLAQSR